jgi:hypothetical protein
MSTAHEEPISGQVMAFYRSGRVRRLLERPGMTVGSLVRHLRTCRWGFTSSAGSRAPAPAASVVHRPMKARVDQTLTR